MKWKILNYHMPLRLVFVVLFCMGLLTANLNLVQADDDKLTVEEQEILEHLELLEMLEMLDDDIDFIELSEKLEEKNDD